MEEKVGEPEKARKLFKAGMERCPDHVHLHQVTQRSRSKHRHGSRFAVRGFNTLVEGQPSRARTVNAQV